MKILVFSGDDDFAVASSVIEPDNLILGRQVETDKNWSWINISVPSLKVTEKVRTIEVSPPEVLFLT